MYNWAIVHSYVTNYQRVLYIISLSLVIIMHDIIILIYIYIYIMHYIITIYNSHPLCRLFFFASPG